MVDVTVRGAGVIGLSVAWACLRRGARVQVVDPHGVGAGASGGVVGALAPHVPEAWNPKKAFQLASLLRSRTHWPEIEAASGLTTGYVRSGRLQPIPDEAALVRARARIAGARAHWGEAATWDIVTPEGAWAPGHRAIHDTLSAHLHPRRACVALAQAIRRGGGTILAEAPDRGRVAHATGVPGLVAMGAGVGVKGQAALLDHDARGRPQIYADGLYVIPHADGTVGIGSTSERDYDDATATDSALDALIDRARALLPVLARAPVLEGWAAARPRARSRGPMLGTWPGRPGHFVANGGFKIGFGLAPEIGEAMADLILEGRADRIPEGFSPADSLSRE
ncbi:MAG: NAD(P)/FAD-dependent oxidoreductase [Shimia sp.]